MNNKIVRPEDILPDGVDSTHMNGIVVRKGTIAAFLANADILESSNVTEQQKQEAVSAMKKLALAVNAVGLHKHVIFKNSLVEQILIDAETQVK